MRYFLQLLPFRDRIEVDRDLKDLIRDSSLMYVAGGLSIALMFLQQITTANLIGAEDYGRFAAIVGSNMLLTLLIDFRTWEAATKLLARSLVEEDHDESASTVTWLSLLDLGSGVFAASVIFVLAAPIADHMLDSPDSAKLVAIYALFIPIRLYGRGVPNALIRLYGRFDWLSGKSIVYAIIRLVFISGLAWLGFGLKGVVVGVLISDLLHVIMIQWMVNRLWRLKADRSTLIRIQRPKRFREGGYLVGNLWIGASIKGLQLETFIPILALLTTPEQVGIYRVSLDIALLVARLTEPLTIVIQPTLIKLFEAKNMKKFMNYIKQSLLVASIIIVPFTLGIIVFGPIILPIFLDKEYSAVPGVVAVLSIGIGANSITLWIRPAMVALDLLKQQNIIWIVMLVFSTTALIFASNYGAIGAAFVMSSLYIGNIGLSLVIFLNGVRKIRAIVSR